MRIVSWNVNGINACVKHGGFEPFYDWIPDIICCQETKNLEEPTAVDGYRHYYLPANKKRFCGMLDMTLEEPKEIICGFGMTEYDEEPRVITADVGDYYIVNTYAPNTVDKLERRIFRVGWTKAYMVFVEGLMKKKPVILCGDFNASLSEFDYYQDNTRKHKIEDMGFESDERTAIQDILDLGFIDAYRNLYPDERDCYTHWPNKNDARSKNRGARLDYFFVDERLKARVKGVWHHSDILGSDHCPIELEVE